jgi:hypothetical protein
MYFIYFILILNEINILVFDMSTNIWIWLTVNGQRTTMKSLLGTIAETNRETVNNILKQLANAIGSDTYKLISSVLVGNGVYTVEFGKKINGVVHPEYTFESMRHALYNIAAGLTTMVGSYSPMQVRVAGSIDSLTGYDVEFSLHYFEEK